MNVSQTGAVIVDILPDSVAAKDNRLKPFDQILEINGQKITPDLNGEQVQRAVKQLQQRVSKGGVKKLNLNK